MSLFKISTQITTLVLAAFLLVGCNVGVSPSGATPEETKAAFDKMPLEERVKLTNGSSMPAEAKKKKIAEMYQKEGKTPPDEVPATTPNNGLPPGMGTPSQGGR